MYEFKKTEDQELLLGRLEVVTILVVFTKNFWRK